MNINDRKRGKNAMLLGAFALILFSCFPVALRAEEITQDLGLWMDTLEAHTPNPYCESSYIYGLTLRWTAPPQGYVCYYSVYCNGVRLGTTGDTSYSVRGISGCFGSYEGFLSAVKAVLDGWYYGQTYKVVAERGCYGLPSLSQEMPIGDEETINRAANPGKMTQAATEKTTDAGDPVNVASGNMHASRTDVLVFSREIPLEFSLTYNSQDDFQGQFGYGWRSNYDVRVKEYPDMRVVETDEKGVHTVYLWDLEDLTYTPSAGKHSELVLNEDYSYMITRKHGRKLTFEPVGRLTRIEERNGNAMTIRRDLQGAISEVEGPDGRKIVFTNDAQGRTTQVTDPAGRVWRYEYDADGNLIRVTDPLNNVTTYVYDGNHKIVQKTDANGDSAFFEYDASGRARHSWLDGMVNEVTLTFDPGGQMTTVMDSRGNATRYDYNAYGLVTQTTDAQGNVRQTAWDADLNKTSFTDENGRTWTFTHDGRGNLLTVIDPLSNTTTFTYEPAFDLLKTATDAQGYVTTCDYDGHGNLIKLTDALGSFSSHVYDALGQLTSSTDPLGHTAIFTYDTYGNLLTMTDAQGHVTTYGYDVVGNRTQVKDAQDNVTQFAYDDLNRLLQITRPDGSTISYSYDAVGNRTSVTDSASNTTQYAYDQNGEVTRVTDPLGNVVEFAYDSEGDLIKITDQKGQETVYQYDALNRLIAETDPLGLDRAYVYDPAGNRISATDAKGQTITYKYDSLDRLTRIIYPDGEVRFAYDALGRRTSMSDSQGTTVYAYDALGRLTQVQGPQPGSTLQYAYDTLGNRTGLIFPDGKTVQYAYDVLGRLATITGPDSQVTAYAYDEVGNLLSAVYPNDTQTTYSYDSLYRLTHLINHRQSDPLQKLSEFDYTYDAAGRRSVVTHLDGAVAYTYDAAGRLLAESKSGGSSAYQRTYEYDPAGNRTRMVKDGVEHIYVYDDANRLIQEDVAGSSSVPLAVTGTVTDANGVASVTVNGIDAALDGDDFSCQTDLVPGPSTLTVVATDAAGNTATEIRHVTYAGSADQIAYQYDDNGNLIRRQSSTETVTFGYDYENRLTSIASAGSSVRYGYDGDGRRVWADDGSAVTGYLYDGMDVLWERDAAGTVLASYLRHPYAAGGIGGIICTQQGADATYYSYDGLGSVSNLSDASGNVLHAYAYDAYGNLLTAPYPGNSRQFLTKEAGLFGIIYFGARYYDPRLGRFLTPDPSGMADGPNLYLYCLNDPVNFADLYGLFGLNFPAPFTPLGVIPIQETKNKTCQKTQTKEANDEIELVGYHATSVSISGFFDTKRSRVFNRFGPGLYLSSTAGGAVAERPGAKMVYRYSVPVNASKVLNLKSVPFLTSKPISWIIGLGARLFGYQAIVFQSRRDRVSDNYAIIDPSSALRARREPANPLYP